METRYFSRARLRADTPDLKALAKLAASNLYREHKLAWRFFSGDPDASRDFLYRRDGNDFYLVSARPPQADPALWELQTKSYQPELQAGEVMQFSLRANPVVSTRLERTPEASAEWAQNRARQGLKARDDNRRLVRHDVVMAAKKRMEQQYDEAWWKNADQAELIHAAAGAWLESQGKNHGFIPGDLSATAYRRETFKDGAGRQAVIARLDFTGVLQVTDPETFLEALFNGIGPAKGFGCGLLLVRRVG